ncbi:hypothetical protein O181_112294 [Austropuccinia psidii MF-1]|uniref:Uncharacterized protein n=1 Tax=Austropuccinia psidii MF-1 TaxID=1389203 RepID=A0A9Q3K1M3_9BASI|nr:hypothetical protein [Austropuccinia psidii MF-1]
MGKNACDTAERCFTSENREPELKEADQVLVLTFSFNIIKGPTKMGLVKPYHQTGEGSFAKRRTALSTENSVKEDPRSPVGRILRDWESKINWKDHRPYFVRCKTQEEDKDKWFPEGNISDVQIHLRGFKASRRTVRCDYETDDNITINQQYYVCSYGI